MIVAGDLLEGLHIQLLNQKAGVCSLKRKEGEKKKEGDRVGRKCCTEVLLWGATKTS